MTKTGLVRSGRIGHCDLPFDLAQRGESFDAVQDREPVERLVETFDICDLQFVISYFYYFNTPIEKLPGDNLNFLRQRQVEDTFV